MNPSKVTTDEKTPVRKWHGGDRIGGDYQNKKPTRKGRNGGGNGGKCFSEGGFG